ncbi:hypothetical protein B1218_39340, partial [Pseudomonas ogarae]
YCNLVDAGEQAGALDTLLDRVATYKEKSEARKSKSKKGGEEEGVQRAAAGPGPGDNGWRPGSGRRFRQACGSRRAGSAT